MIRNAEPNPSAELATATAWEVIGGTYGRYYAASVNFDAGDRRGIYTHLATASGGSSFLYLRSPNTSGGRFPVVAGQWVGFRAWLTSDAGMIVGLRIHFTLADGTPVSTVASTFETVRADGIYVGRIRSLTAQAPATAERYRVEVLATGDPYGSEVIATRRLFADAIVHGIGATEAEALTLAATYRDGDTAGWAWEGTAHASASYGPAVPYEPEARITRLNTFADWADIATELAFRSEGAGLVQPNTQGAVTPDYTVRPAGPSTVTLRIVFARELATGYPGPRAAAFEAMLRTGGAFRVEWLTGEPGARTLDLAATGAITRAIVAETAGRSRAAAWTVDAECTVLAEGAP